MNQKFSGFIEVRLQKRCKLKKSTWEEESLGNYVQQERQSQLSHQLVKANWDEKQDEMKRIK